MKQYYPAIWHLVPWKNAWQLMKAGEYEPGVMAEDTDIIAEITEPNIQLLIKALDEAGWIKPRLDERLRTEDLKITHRLLDLLTEKK